MTHAILPRRRAALRFAAAGAVAALARPVFAQDTRPVRIVVGYAPGGPLDSVARALAPRLSDELKVPVIVENRVGASGIIAGEVVARSAPDGTTLILQGITHALQPALGVKLPYDPVNDFTPVAIVGWAPLILAVHPGLPVRTVADLVALSRRSKVAYGSSGSGTSPHLAMEIFKRASGADLLHVAYKGSAPAITDAIAGNVQCVLDVSATALPQVRAGKLRALAITGSHRHPDLPDVPTIREAGFPAADVSTWWGILGPARMPRPMVDTLNAGLMKALQAPDVKQRFAALGGDPTGAPPEEFARVLRDDIARFTAVIKEAGIKPE